MVSKILKGLVKYATPKPSTDKEGKQAEPKKKKNTATTLAVGEEAGSSPKPGKSKPFTTMAVGEEGSGKPPTMTTMAVGEEGSSKP